MFTARYLDLFTNYISLYNTCMKVKSPCHLFGPPEAGEPGQGFREEWVWCLRSELLGLRGEGWGLGSWV